jgi:hypothetical protein
MKGSREWPTEHTEDTEEKPKKNRRKTGGSNQSSLIRRGCDEWNFIIHIFEASDWPTNYTKDTKEERERSTGREPGIGNH